MMSAQEREHWDYEAGCATELQNAFARSQMERDQGNVGETRTLLLLGYHVVVSVMAQYCRSTDAALGSRRRLVHSTLDGDEAKRMCRNLNEDIGDCDGEFYYTVESPQEHTVALPPKPIDDDECPF
jgi:hypothetical protein